MKKYFITVFIILLMALGACENEADREDVQSIVLAGGEWDSIMFHNGIVKKILEEGYGYEADILTGSTAAVLQGVRQGEIDIFMEVWTGTMKEVYEAGTEAGDLVTVGTNFSSEANGFHVPTYVIEGDPERGIEPIAPDLRTVEDLKNYAHIFEDPEDPDKGRFYNGPSSWAVKEIMDEKFEGYGLGEMYNNFTSGSEAAMNASIADAYEKGEAWLGYAYSPTATTALYDLTLLEEAPYDEEIYNETRMTERPPQDVLIVVHTDFNDEFPDAIEFLSKYKTTPEMTEEGVKYMLENDSADVSAPKTANWWLSENEDIWTEWVPEEVAEKVKESIEN